MAQIRLDSNWPQLLTSLPAGLKFFLKKKNRLEFDNFSHFQWSEFFFLVEWTLNLTSTHYVQVMNLRFMTTNIIVIIINLKDLRSLLSCFVLNDDFYKVEYRVNHRLKHAVLSIMSDILSHILFFGWIFHCDQGNA